MEKPKRKGRPNRRKWIVAILLILFGACAFVGFKVANFIMYINQEQHFVNLLLGDIENIYDDGLVEARLLEYVTIGESIREEVQAFGDEQLDDPYYPCHVSDESTQICYFIDRRPVFPCAQRLLYILFIFEADILIGIEFDENQICL